jgi:hypothetical protein
MRTLRDPPERLPERTATNHDTLNARLDLLPTPVAVPAARRRMVALLTGWEAAQRHEDVALLVGEVSPTRSNTPEAKSAWSWSADALSVPFRMHDQAVLHGHNPHSHAAMSATCEPEL